MAQGAGRLASGQAGRRPAARDHRLTFTSEKQFQHAIVQWAGLNGWWVHHHYDARRSTPGFPDLLLVRPPELIYAEVKTDTGRLTPEQRRVLEMLEATGAEVHVWRPADWDDVIRRLRRVARNDRLQ